MTTEGDRRARIACFAWLVISVVVGNGMYDLLMTRAAKEVLYRAAAHEAGRGPFIPAWAIMSESVYDAAWKSTLTASLILLAGLLTIRFLNGRGKW
jgi:hypothetical protein